MESWQILVRAQNVDDWGSCEKDYIWNPSTCDCECNKTWKSVGNKNTKSCSWKKRLIDKLVLACEGEILTKTKISLDDEKVTCDEISFLVHNILLIIICLILIVSVSISKWTSNIK